MAGGFTTSLAGPRMAKTEVSYLDLTIDGELLLPWPPRLSGGNLDVVSAIQDGWPVSGWWVSRCWGSQSPRRRIVLSSPRPSWSLRSASRSPPARLSAAGCTMGAAALYRRDQRRRRTGPRHTGTDALALWPLSLTPIAGIGASLSWMAALPVLDAMQWSSCSP